MNMETNTEKIEEIERELSIILEIDKKSWVRIWELMTEVDNKNLWENKYNSYTAWVKHLSNKYKVHESLLWKRKSAGNIYSKFYKRATEKGIDVPDIHNVSVSPDNFELIEKIAQGNNKVADELTIKTLKGDLKRKDLKNAWNTVKAKGEEKGKKVIKKNGYDTLIKNNDIDNFLEKIFENKETQNKKITATDIVLALGDSFWLSNGAEDEAFEIKGNKSQGRYKHSKYIYSTMTEFPVYTGTSRHSRRIDIAIFENMTNENPFEINVHGVEIKVDEFDLNNDHKMSEYVDFVDYFWLAIPNKLKKSALKFINKSWGVIVIDDNKKPSILKKPVKNNPVMKLETLTTALIKVL